MMRSQQTDIAITRRTGPGGEGEGEREGVRDGGEITGGRGGKEVYRREGGRR